MDILKAGIEALQRTGFLRIVSSEQDAKVFQARVSSGDKALTFTYDSKGTLAYVLPGEALVAKKISELGALKVIAAAFSFGDGEFKDAGMYPDLGFDKTIKSAVFYPVQCSDRGVIYETHNGHRFIHQGEDHILSLMGYKAAYEDGTETNFMILASLEPVLGGAEYKSISSSMSNPKLAAPLVAAKYPSNGFDPEAEFVGPILSSKSPQVLEIGDKSYLASDLEKAHKIRSSAWELLLRGEVSNKLNLTSSLADPIPKQVILVSSGDEKKKETSAIFSSAGGYSLFTLSRPIDSVKGQQTLEGDAVKDFLKSSKGLLVRSHAEDVTRIVSGAFYDIKASRVEADGTVTASVFDGVNVSVQPMQKILQSLGLDEGFSTFNRVRLVDFGRNRLQAPVFSALEYPVPKRRLPDGDRGNGTGKETFIHLLQRANGAGVDKKLIKKAEQYWNEGDKDSARKLLAEQLPAYDEMVPQGAEEQGRARAGERLSRINRRMESPLGTPGGTIGQAQDFQEQPGSSFDPFQYDDDEQNAAFNTAEALYNYLSSYHGGQSSPEYSALSRLGQAPISYSPGAMGTPDFEDEDEMAGLDGTGEHEIPKMIYDDIKASGDWQSAFEWLESYCSRDDDLNQARKYGIDGEVVLEYRDDGKAVRKTFDSHRQAENYAKKEDLDSYEIIKKDSIESALGDPETGRGFRPSALVEKRWPSIERFLTRLREQGVKFRRDVIQALIQRYPELGQEGAQEAYYQFYAAHSALGTGEHGPGLDKETGPIFDGGKLRGIVPKNLSDLDDIDQDHVNRNDRKGQQPTRPLAQAWDSIPETEEHQVENNDDPVDPKHESDFSKGLDTSRSATNDESTWKRRSVGKPWTPRNSSLVTQSEEIEGPRKFTQQTPVDMEPVLLWEDAPDEENEDVFRFARG